MLNRRRTSEKKAPTKYRPIQDNIQGTILQKWTSLSINIMFSCNMLLGQVELEESGNLCMKEISKALVLLKQSVHCIMRELQFLTQLRHNFVINIFAAFQDNQNLYLVLDYLGGGDLPYHLGRQRKFAEQQTIIAKLLLLKQNFSLLVLQWDWSICMRIIQYIEISNHKIQFWIIQFMFRLLILVQLLKKLAKISKTRGTPGFMSPEVIFRQDHGAVIDFFDFGVICYEFMTGRRPYYGNRREIREQIFAKQVFIQRSNEGWSKEKPQNRLIIPRQHRWFMNFSFELLIQKQLKAPFIPNSQDNFDKSQIIYEDEEYNQIIRLHQHMILESQEQFEGFQYQERSQQFLINIVIKLIGFIYLCNFFYFFKSYNYHIFYFN
ncbi:unnamed protein product (macronuclear) [Paramecium tetraurelia]|uniref:Protein kinase domain-containing protein n=1 Tax=Paramecium tetraurelia TaxID=5888 RepID=A0DMQ8_PARTE|nr:uncharacterized protein GSPATT00018529001 [Paramecium tetraurelia]CAK84325.1 unnamed protein product [Paramecium tetraurelia]|eukprot:XP_001451722.1 hypothetical protein (macronuclear) [Paramecium tetraurelia strain d4-2]